MKRARLAHAVAVGLMVAGAARISEDIATVVTPTNHRLHDYIGASITFITASILFYAWRSAESRRLSLLREREKVRQHMHHHIRNALNAILMKHHKDDLVRSNVDRIVRELEAVLPSRPQHWQEIHRVKNPKAARH